MAHLMTASKHGYYRGRHSCFLLQYHLVLTTKYRHPVLTGPVEEFLRTYTTTYFKDHFAPIIKMEIMPEHIHILFETDPTTRLDTFINAFKAASSRLIRSRYPEELSKWYWEPLFWARTYFIASVSEQSTAIVKRYIEMQKERK